MILPSALSTRWKRYQEEGPNCQPHLMSSSWEEDFQFPFSDLKIARKIFFYFNISSSCCSSFVRDLGPSGSYEISAQSFYTVDEVLLCSADRLVAMQMLSFLLLVWAVADEVIFSFSFSVFRRDEKKSTAQQKNHNTSSLAGMCCVLVGAARFQDRRGFPTSKDWLLSHRKCSSIRIRSLTWQEEI